jgi:hypothetical protein
MFQQIENKFNRNYFINYLSLNSVLFAFLLTGSLATLSVASTILVNDTMIKK